MLYYVNYLDKKIFNLSCLLYFTFLVISMFRVVFDFRQSFNTLKTNFLKVKPNLPSITSGAENGINEVLI